ncbi:hypothetical protein M514_06329, partial [Trichuris suis]
MCIPPISTATALIEHVFCQLRMMNLHVTLIFALLLTKVTTDFCPADLSNRFMGTRLRVRGTQKCLTWLSEPSRTKTRKLDLCSLLFQGRMISMKHYDDMKSYFNELGKKQNRSLIGKKFQIHGRVSSATDNIITVQFDDDNTKYNFSMAVSKETLNRTENGHFRQLLCIFSEVGSNYSKWLGDCNNTKVEGRLCLSELIEVNAFAGESKTSCAPERQGSLCLFSDDPCKAPNPCRHNGRCNSTEGSFQCNCTSSRYTGDKCQDGKAFSSLIQPYSCIQVITLCNSHNCGTGRCDEVKRNKTLQPFCTCKAGTTGPTCNENVNFCKGVHCYYDKTCINGASDYTCQCGEGYEGKKCEKEIESAGINKVILIAAGGGGGFVLLFALCGIFLLSHRKKKKRRALGRSSLAMGSVMESSMAGQSILASILKGSTMKSTVSRTESTMNKKGATKNATPTKSPSPKKVKNP